MVTEIYKSNNMVYRVVNTAKHFGKPKEYDTNHPGLEDTCTYKRTVQKLTTVQF